MPLFCFIPCVSKRYPRNFSRKSRAITSSALTKNSYWALKEGEKSLSVITAIMYKNTGSLSCNDVLKDTFFFSKLIFHLASAVNILTT